MNGFKYHADPGIFSWRGSGLLPGSETVPAVAAASGQYPFLCERGPRDAGTVRRKRALELLYRGKNRTGGDERKKDQLIKQISKLYDVKKVEVMQPENTILRELMIVKISATGEKLREVLDAASVFRSKVVDMSPGSVCVEITGEAGKLNAFLTYVKDYGILEYCRTGLIAVERGKNCMFSQPVKEA